MSRINIDGIEYYQCYDCGNLTSGFCRCMEAGKSETMIKLLSMFRKKNTIHMFCTPYQSGVKDA